MINEQPRPGSVTVDPGSGIAYQTKFNVRGSSFSDYEDGSSMSFYKFGYRLYTGGPITWFHEGSELQTPSFWIVIKMYFRWHVLRLYLFVLLNPWDWQYIYIYWKWSFSFFIEIILLMTDWVLEWIPKNLCSIFSNVMRTKCGFNQQDQIVLHECIFIHSIARNDNSGFENPFPDGLESENFQVSVIVRAYDRSGAYANASISVTVRFHLSWEVRQHQSIT